jgi:hypothetical protein
LVSLASRSPLAEPKPIFLLLKQADDFLGKFQEFLSILLDSGSCAEFPPAFLILALHALPPNLQEVWEEEEILYTAGDRAGQNLAPVVALLFL